MIHELGSAGIKVTYQVSVDIQGDACLGMSQSLLASQVIFETRVDCESRTFITYGLTLILRMPDRV